MLLIITLCLNLLIGQNENRSEMFMINWMDWVQNETGQ